MQHNAVFKVDMPLAILDVIANPVLVKDSNLKYLWVNRAFEDLFGTPRDSLIGRLDIDVFQDRQVAQCNGGDLRVLNDGEIDEAYETVIRDDGSARETLTRKSRLTLPSGEHVLVGVMHDLTDIMAANAALTEAKKELEQKAQELDILARTDALTGCENRRSFFENVSGLPGSAKGSGLMIMDLDHFKRINDTYGHDVGDQALLHFCALVRKRLRDGDRFVRMGGEEFAIYLTDTAREDFRAIGQRLCDDLAKAPMELEDGTQVTVTVSIGMLWNKAVDKTALPEMVRIADEALYQAKTSGRNQICLVDSAA